MTKKLTPFRTESSDDDADAGKMKEDDDGNRSVDDGGSLSERGETDEWRRV